MPRSRSPQRTPRVLRKQNVLAATSGSDAPCMRQRACRLGAYRGPGLIAAVARVNVDDEQVVGDDAIAQPIMLGEPATDHVEIGGRVLKAVRGERGEGMLAWAPAARIAARAGAGLGDAVQRQNRVAVRGEPQRRLDGVKRYLAWVRPPLRDGRPPETTPAPPVSLHLLSPIRNSSSSASPGVSAGFAGAFPPLA